MKLIDLVGKVRYIGRKNNIKKSAGGLLFAVVPTINFLKTAVIPADLQQADKSIIDFLHRAELAAQRAGYGNSVAYRIIMPAYQDVVTVIGPENTGKTSLFVDILSGRYLTSLNNIAHPDNINNSLTMKSRTSENENITVLEKDYSPMVQLGAGKYLQNVTILKQIIRDAFETIEQNNDVNLIVLTSRLKQTLSRHNIPQEAIALVTVLLKTLPSNQLQALIERVRERITEEREEPKEKQISFEQILRETLKREIRQILELTLGNISTLASYISQEKFLDTVTKQIVNNILEIHKEEILIGHPELDKNIVKTIRDNIINTILNLFVTRTRLRTLIVAGTEIDKNKEIASLEGALKSNLQEIIGAKENLPEINVKLINDANVTTTSAGEALATDKFPKTLQEGSWFYMPPAGSYRLGYNAAQDFVFLMKAYLMYYEKEALGNIAKMVASFEKFEKQRWLDFLVYINESVINYAETLEKESKQIWTLVDEASAKDVAESVAELIEDDYIENDLEGIDRATKEGRGIIRGTDTNGEELLFNIGKIRSLTPESFKYVYVLYKITRNPSHFINFLKKKKTIPYISWFKLYEQELIALYKDPSIPSSFKNFVFGNIPLFVVDKDNNVKINPQLYNSKNLFDIQIEQHFSNFVHNFVSLLAQHNINTNIISDDMKVIETEKSVITYSDLLIKMLKDYEEIIKIKNKEEAVEKGEFTLPQILMFLFFETMYQGVFNSVFLSSHTYSQHRVSRLLEQLNAIKVIDIWETILKETQITAGKLFSSSAPLENFYELSNKMRDYVTQAFVVYAKTFKKAIEEKKEIAHDNMVAHAYALSVTYDKMYKQLHKDETFSPAEDIYYFYIANALTHSAYLIYHFAQVDPDYYQYSKIVEKLFDFFSIYTAAVAYGLNKIEFPIETLKASKSLNTPEHKTFVQELLDHNFFKIYAQWYDRIVELTRQSLLSTASSIEASEIKEMDDNEIMQYFTQAVSLSMPHLRPLLIGIIEHTKYENMIVDTIDSSLEEILQIYKDEWGRTAIGSALQAYHSWGYMNLLKLNITELYNLFQMNPLLSTLVLKSYWADTAKQVTKPQSFTLSDIITIFTRVLEQKKLAIHLGNDKVLTFAAFYPSFLYVINRTMLEKANNSKSKNKNKGKSQNKKSTAKTSSVLSYFDETFDVDQSKIINFMLRDYEQTRERYNTMLSEELAQQIIENEQVKFFGGPDNTESLNF